MCSGEVPYVFGWDIFAILILALIRDHPAFSYEQMVCWEVLEGHVQLTISEMKIAFDSLKISHISTLGYDFRTGQILIGDKNIS